MGISLKPAHLKRYKDVAWLLAKHGRRDLVTRSGLEEALEDETPQSSVAEGEDLADDLEAMGPTFIKVGQFLSTRADLLPAAYLESLARLQDRVASFPFCEVERIVTSELGVRLS